MSTRLRSRADLRRALYRLIGGSPSDTSLTEHDDQPGDTVNGWLEQGFREAQFFVINRADANRWLRRWEVPVSSLEGSDRDGGRYVDLPDDFLRAAGTLDLSPMWRGRHRWGKLVENEWKTRTGNYFWIQNDRLWFAPLAKPRGIELEYFYQIPVPTRDDPAEEGGEIDFPEDDRMLIVAYAALEASDHPQFPGGLEHVGKIQRLARRWENRVAQRARRSQQPRRVKHSRALGNRFYSRGT